MDKKRSSTKRPNDKKVDDEAQGLKSKIKEVGKEPANIEDSVDASIQGLEDY